MAYLFYSGLKSHWKAPVAFFFTRGLQAETQKELVLHTLHALHDRGFVVHCITMDGHATNLGMSRMLGAQMANADQLKPYFTLPDHTQKIFILLDPCHMIKLVRNMLHCYGVIKSPQGEIRWSFIQDLHKIQETIGLRLANKLSSRHIDYQQNKMKVRKF